MYKLIKIYGVIDTQVIFRVADMASISPYPENPEYQAYLAWLAEGNVPTPADEVTQ
jgi:hypothetical protein